jgi:hypothetical protein
VRRWTSGLLAALLLVLAGWVLAPTASACSCTGGTTADRALGADAVFSGRLADREVVGGPPCTSSPSMRWTTGWWPTCAAGRRCGPRRPRREELMLTGVSAPEPGSAGTELPGGPSDTALEAVVAVLLVAAFAGGLVLRRRAGG